MSTVEANLEKVLRLHKISRFAGAVLIPLFVSLIFNALIPGGGLIWWVSFLLTCWMAHAVIMPFAMVVIVLAVTAANPVDEENVEPGIERLTLTISDTPDEPIGRFMDSEFFEWLELTDSNGTKHKATFFGTIDMTKEFILPARCIVMPPGLFYQLPQVVEQVNIPTMQQ